MAYVFNDDKSKKDIIDLIYPVGSIYMSVNNVNPGDLFGGTWVAWGSGRVPVGVDVSETEFNVVEKTGGDKTVKLTAAQSGVPAHGHGTGDATYNRFMAIKSGTTIDLPKIGSPQQSQIATVYPYVMQLSEKVAPTKITNIGNNTAADASAAHTNLQPYITCYMYKRIA